MRQVAAIILLSTGLFAAPRTDVTLLLKFSGDHSAASIEAMKREVSSIMANAGTSIQFRSYEEAVGSESAGRLVIVRFNGSCKVDRVAIPFDERGPLAFTHTTEGAVLPYSQVECDRVTRSVHSALWGSDHARADELLGRALGRVLAHELYHILGNTAKHGAEGVAQTSLTARELIGARMSLQPDDIERMHHH